MFGIILIMEKIVLIMEKIVMVIKQYKKILHFCTKNFFLTWTDHFHHLYRERNNAPCEVIGADKVDIVGSRLSQLVLGALKLLHIL